MAWKAPGLMSVRETFCQAALCEGANVRALCREYQISPKTAYKWLRRYQADGSLGLQDCSRRPLHSPRRTSEAMEAVVLAARDAHPTWGGRKLRAYLLAQGHSEVPAASTLTALLHRYDRIPPRVRRSLPPSGRFEHPQPNALWQMDFKGYFALRSGGVCHPLTILDDHSRFLLGLWACPNERTETVKSRLEATFRQYGLPERILCDHGAPWGDSPDTRYTRLGVWLLQLGVKVSHGRPAHPQTQGKDERLHRTLNEELLSRRPFADLEECQARFEPWRQSYNEVRPHEACQDRPPSCRYQTSERPFPETLPPVTYAPGETVRKVDPCGVLSFQNHRFRIGRGFAGQSVALRGTEGTTGYIVHFGVHPIAALDLEQGTCRPLTRNASPSGGEPPQPEGGCGSPP